MANVRLISASLVQATTNTRAGQRIDLNPSDLLLLLANINQKGLLFHKPKTTLKDHDIGTLIQHLKASLSRTLDIFTPLSGRLATVSHQDNTTSFYIDCNNLGAEFVHAIADDVAIFDILDPVYVPPLIRSLFPLNDVKNIEGVHKPLLAVQVTELVDGIFIGCSINHSVIDGSSFWNFFNCWSEIARGAVEVSKPPVLERWFLDDEKYRPLRVPNSDIEENGEGFILPPLKEKVFHFSKEQISRFKAKANADAGTNNISSLQSLLAHIWQTVTRNRQLDPDQDTLIRIHIGLRSRMKPPLQEESFCNAIYSGVVTLKAGELIASGIGCVALEIQKMIARHTKEKLKENIISWIENGPKPVKLSVVAGHNNALMTGSSPRFRVYSNDFGWGKPIAVRSGPANKFDGKLTLFPGVEEGSVDIEACLRPEVLQAMEKDSEFMTET